MKRSCALVVALPLFLLGTPALAAEKVFHLKNGRTIQGELVDETRNGYVVKTQSGGQTTIPRDMVVTIEDVAPATPAADPSPSPAPKLVLPPPKPSESPSSGEPAKKTPATPESSTPPPLPPPPAGSFKPGQLKNELDMPDENGLVPSYARLGGSTEPAAARDVPEFLKKDFETFLESTVDPDAIAAWVKEKVQGDRNKLEYAQRIMQTWSRNPRQRRAVWRAWIESEPLDRAEQRILPFATSDLWNTRMDACLFLTDYGTWERSTDSLLRVLSVPHETSSAYAYTALGGMIRRQMPSNAIIDRIIDVHRAARGKAESIRWWSLCTLAVCSECGSKQAATYVRDTYTKAERPEKVNMVEPVLKGLDHDESRRFVLGILDDGTTEGRAQWSLAAHALPRFGDFADLPVVVRLLDQGPDEIDTGLGTQQSVKTIVIDVVATFAQRPKFGSVADLKDWWEGSVRSVLENRDALMASTRLGGPAASSAIERLAPIRLPEVDKALREAASSNPDATNRAAAAKVIAKRADRKGAPAILEALKKADGATRDTIVFALRTLALGEPFPTGNAEHTEQWWRRRFPDDFAN